MEGWPGEKWLDVRRLDILGPIMKARLDLCQKKKFDGVEFDNVDVYSNSDSGFYPDIKAQDQINYNLFLANEAHTRGLAAGLKNDIADDQLKALSPSFDFAINEQCFQYNECALLQTYFTAKNKPVFHVEYEISRTRFCADALRMGFSSMKKRYDLDAWREVCQ
jgi:hypothetical protein